MFALRPKPFLFKGDHTYPASNPESPVVILYAEIGTEDFYRFHKLLVAKAEAGEITYVLRHYIAVSMYAQVKQAGVTVQERPKGKVISVSSLKLTLA